MKNKTKIVERATALVAALMSQPAGLVVETVDNIGSKSSTVQTIKVKDTLTGREYFMRCGLHGKGWCTVKNGYSGTTRKVVQYGVMSLAGYRSPLDFEESVFVVERHMTKQRRKLGIA